MDLTNLHALLNDQKGGLSKRIDFASTRIQAARYTSLLPYGRIGDTAEDLTSSEGRCPGRDSQNTSKAPVCRQPQAWRQPYASAYGICHKPRPRGRPARGNASGCHG